MLGRLAAGFAVVALFVGAVIWSILVLQAFGKWSGGYCEDYACYEARPLALAIQATIALIGVAVGTGIQIRCVRYALGGDPPGLRTVGHVLVIAVCVGAWVLYTHVAGVASWKTS